eukprot:scaffold874_cov126-Cylindrotheca_fusiformis.AAC.19
MMKVGLNPNHFSGRRKKLNSNNRGSIGRNRGSCSLATVSVGCLFFIGLVYAFFLFQYRSLVANPEIHVGDASFLADFANPSNPCQFRKYPPRRYYGLANTKLPNFLKTEYIYGELPQRLEPKPGSSNKMCVNQSEWLTGDRSRLPFADGTNPSLLRIRNNPRVNSELLGALPQDAYYLATICMTNSQCAWKDTPHEQEFYKLSTQKEPLTVRTVLLVLNEHFETIEEATIYTLIDAPFGKRIRPKNNDDSAKMIFALDDARLFTHQGNIWISYREGKVFGYDKQVLNRLHIINSTNILEFTLKASEVETLCCGRNMALIDSVHTDRLQALTWVDPVTVVDVELSNDNYKEKADQFHRRLVESPAEATPTGRRLAEKTKESHFHGTNGFMVHLPESGEYLGIGHFHRPPSRDFDNPYARFGHHYTHAFFTISDQPPYHLHRLSPELVLPSQAYPMDAEVIQFWSGLELLEDGLTLAMAYGINDCEGAATYLDISVITGLLRVVPEGKEVVDLLEPLSI